MTCPIPTRVVANVAPAPENPRAVERAFRRLLDAGARLLPAGAAKRDPRRLLGHGYTPKHAIELFGTRFYLTNVRQNPLLRFFVAYVVPPQRAKRGAAAIYPRIFYKDVSLIWRCASHIVYNHEELWIGKGDVRSKRRGDYEHFETVESTTDLPLELQAGLEVIMRRTRVVRRDTQALLEVLRNAPPHRLWPYPDFSAPRRRAEACSQNLIHGGRRIAHFRRRHDPTSLVFARGFAPDFSRRGLIDRDITYSASYGGEVQHFRVLSENRKVQFQFVATPKHAWLFPPQALTTELTSYGVRTIHVEVDDDLCLPGYEYHFQEYEDDPDSLHSQIPPGFAGAPNAKDPDRADASAWLEQLPVVREFRRKLL